RMLIDPFAQGRIMTSEEAQGRMQEIFGEDAEWSEDLLRPASNRHWLTRMLQNLLNIFGSSGAYQDVAAMLEMEILLWPEQMRLQRDLALVLARLGMAEPASKWLDNYLRSNPDDPQCGDLKQLLEVLSA
ncbi:MAG: tetratricopeptide repeat protein, partial [Phycisphaerae bacterium]